MDKTVPAGAAKLLDFIGSKEAPEGYGTIYANRQNTLPKPLTSMTVAEIQTAQVGWSRRKNGSSACGRYQFMRTTLKSLIAEGVCRPGDKFTPDLQDRLGYALLRRRGYAAFMSGRISRTAFGKSLAQEWASFPVLAACQGRHRKVKRGETYYAGDGINKVLIRPAQVEAVLDALKATKPVRRPAAVPLPARKPEGLPLPPMPSSTGTPEDEDHVEREEAEYAAAAAADPSPPLARKIQELLKAKGYHEVGIVGSGWGPRSKDTLAAWKASWNRRHPDNPVALGDVVTGDIVTKLEGDDHRPISVERATATDAKDIPDDTSWFNRIWNRIFGGVAATAVGGASLTAETDSGTSALDKVEEVSNGWLRVQGILDSFGGFAMDHWLIIVIVGLGLAWAGKEYWKKRKLDKFRAGELVV